MVRTKKDFEKIIRKKYSKDERKILLRAFDVSEKAHEGQVRASGEPYFLHPLAVAESLVTLGLDVESVAAGFLHDALEDTQLSEEDIRKDFSENILTLVQGVTNINKMKFKFKTREDEQAENWRKMLLATSKDIRIIIIKIADRLHNMRTLVHKDAASQVRISKETLEIYSPIAARLGMGRIKGELEDLSMKYIYPEEYYNILDEISQRMLERKKLISESKQILISKLEERGIDGEVNGRPKHIYSIYRKMQTGKTFDQIYDLIALRIIVPTVKHCYEMLGVIHTVWKPLQGRFKDYIAMPKLNMYQSLHTTVMTGYGIPIEIQIRTREMHEVAERGIAAHWMYKENKKQSSTVSHNKQDQYVWIREMLENQEGALDSKEFLENLKMDLYPNEVFAFTPNGDVISLQNGSTVLDFAYKIHSEIGHRCVGGKINSKIVPISTKLKNSDIVEIITSKNSKGPSRDWLNIVITPSAKSKIKAFFKRTMRPENIVHGKQMLEREAKKRGYIFNNLIEKKEIQEYVLNKYSVHNLDDFYALVGFGGITTNQALNKLIELYNKEEKKSKTIVTVQESNKKTQKKKSGINVLGYDDLLIKISKCCNPIPGDKIFGYITRGKGIGIHRTDCPNIKGFERERIVEAEWVKEKEDLQDVYLSELKITVESRTKLPEITQFFTQKNIALRGLNIKIAKDNSVIINVSLDVKNKDNLNDVVDKLITLPSVLKVERC